MNWMGPRFSVRVTHAPTGEQATIDSYSAKTLREAHNKATKLLRSKVWAAQNGIHRPKIGEVVANYNLPDDAPFPNELGDYRVSR